MTETSLNDRLAQWVVQGLARLCSTYAIVQGVAIVAGGRVRWSGPSYASALQVPGAPASWGVALGLFGALALISSFRRPARGRKRPISMSGVWAGLWLQAGWSFFFSMSFLKTAYLDDHVYAAGAPRPATSGIFTYALIGCVCMVLGTGYGFSRRLR